MYKNILIIRKIRVAGFLLLTGSVLFFQSNVFAQTKKAAKPKSEIAKTTQSEAGLKLPSGFSATIVADNLGRARHIAVTPQNDIYVRLARPKMDREHFFCMR